MGTKLHPGEFDAYAAALLDEPLFVLLARDSSAPAMLRQWADMRRRELLKVMDRDSMDDETWLERVREDLRKCTSADELADDMEIWRRRNEGVWREQSQTRLPLEAMDALAAEAIAGAVRHSLAKLCMIGLGQITLEEHRINPWSMPGFNVRRHYFRFSSPGGHFAVMAGKLHPELPEFIVNGHDVTLGDVLAKVKSPDDLRLEIQLVEV